MANTTTKKTTNQTKTTKEVSTSEVKSDKTVRKAEQKKFNRDDEIECVSVTVGGLTLIGSKSKDEYRWEDYGDTAYVRYDDLQALFSTKSVFLTYPLFMILDEDLVNQWGSLLKPIYDKVKDNDIEDVFTLGPDAFRARISAMPEGLKESVRSKASQMIQENRLFDIRIIKIIDEVLGTAFVELVI